jgi:putative ABC transport system permease protein
MLYPSLASCCQDPISPIVATQLYQVSPLDLRVFVSVPLLLLVVALVATWIPANRARKVDPGEMLRIEN